MAVLQISIDNLANGQEITMNQDVTVTVSPYNECSMFAWQIDDHQMKIIDVPAGPPNPLEFEFEITAQDCPDSDTWYLLNVYAWNRPPAGGSADLYIESITFKRIDPTVEETPGPGGLGGIG